jgi:hypothetical protein
LYDLNFAVGHGRVCLSFCAFRAYGPVIGDPKAVTV